MIIHKGFDPKSVKTECVGRKLVVIGREEHKVSADDFSTKEFKKVLNLKILIFSFSW